MTCAQLFKNTKLARQREKEMEKQRVTQEAAGGMETVSQESRGRKETKVKRDEQERRG